MEAIDESIKQNRNIHNNIDVGVTFLDHYLTLPQLFYVFG